MRQKYRESAKRDHAREKSYREQHRKFMASFEKKENEVRWDFSTIKGRLTYINSQLTPCVGCGETDRRVLTFHHLDPSKKLWDVKMMARGNFYKSIIDAEIAKCEVRCLNCHRLIHWKWQHGVDDDPQDNG